MTGERARTALHRFVAAVEARDLDAVVACFVPTAVYGNVPHPPARGSAQIRGMFEPIVSRSQRIRWDIHAEAALEELAFAERTDRFWIDGSEYAIECNGVYRVDPSSGLLAEVRDYCDLGVWRARLGDVLAGPGA